MFVWLENGEVKVAFQKELAPEGAIEIDTLGLNPIPPVEAFIKIENGQIRVKTDDEKLQYVKQKAINELSQKTSTYILKYYTENKQRSDISDKENGESYLVYKGLDVNALRKDITSLILSNSDFQSALNTLNQKYNTDNEPMIYYWLSQLLKIAYRQYFVFQVKQEYATYLQQIQQATSLPLPSFEFKTPFPTLP